MVLEVEGLSTAFKTDVGNIRAVDNVSFTLEKGKVIGIIYYREKNVKTAEDEGITSK